MDIITDLFTDMSPFDRLIFRVSVCVNLGEDPEDHGLTLEEVDFICYMIWDNDDQYIYRINEGDFLFPNGYHEVFRARGVNPSKHKNTRKPYIS